MSVAPFTGVWIETVSVVMWKWPSWVAPFTGVWIEINLSGHLLLPAPVAPFTGVWIETPFQVPTFEGNGRALHGRVD